MKTAEPIKMTFEGHIHMHPSKMGWTLAPPGEYDGMVCAVAAMQEQCRSLFALL